MSDDTFDVRRESDPIRYRRHVERWLLGREPEHNVLLGLLPKLESGVHEFGAPVYLASIERRGAIVGCAFRTPPYKLGVTRLPPGAERTLMADVAEVYETLPAILGREEDATRCADAWCRLRGGRWLLGMRQRIHCLERLVEPRRVPPGAFRVAREGERDLVMRWLDAFARETTIGGSASGVLADVLLVAGDVFIWDAAGPGAMVAVPGYTPHGARVGFVYTPPERRGRGYATAAVAALSRRLLASGRRFCMLYTDLANPVSNGIYARLGYQPVVDVVDVNFQV